MASPNKKRNIASSIIKEWREHKCKGFVYLITCVPEQKSYIGITRRSPKQRFQGHKKRAERGQGDYASLQEALRTYDDDCFKYEILAEAKTLGELSDKEVFYIDELSTLTPVGYNKNRGGSVAIGAQPFFFQDELFQSLADLADHYDIYEETLRKRLRAGWTMLESLGLELRPKIKVAGESFEVAKKKFISQAELCEHFEISLNSFRSRQRMGWSLEESVGLEEREKKQYVVAGVEYKTLVDVYTHYQLDKEKMASRLKSGMSLEAAVFTDQLPGNRASVKVDGIDFNSISEAARHFKIEISKAHGRLKAGYGVEVAFGLEDIPPAQHKRRDRDDFIVDGVLYTSFAELEKHFSISQDTIRSRLNRGASLLEALRMPPREAKKYKLGDEDFTLSELSGSFKIGRQTIEYRLKQGWSVKQAVGLELKPLLKKTTIELEGKKFSSIRQASLHYGLNRNTINARIRYGYSLEEAFGLKARETEQIAKVYVLTKDGESWTVNNIKQFAKKNGLNQSFLGNIKLTMTSDKHHTALGYSIREATSFEQKTFYDQPENKFKKIGIHHVQSVTYKGISYQSKKVMCEHFGVKVAYFYAFYDELQDIDLTMNKLLKIDS